MLGAIALAAISTFGTVKNEIETGHTMLGKIVTAYPRWVLDAAVGCRTPEYGALFVGVWTASELTDVYDDVRRRTFNEIDPRVGYAYSLGLADGWSIDSQVEFQHSQMHYADCPDSFRQWIFTETLRTPYVDAYGFCWLVTHPYCDPAYRLGLCKDVPVYGTFSIEPHVYLDLGTQSWNERRFGQHTADPAHYEGGASAINVHLLGYWRWNENVKLYAGVRHISVVQDEIRRQYDAWDSPNAKADFTYFVVGVYLTF